MQSYGCGAVLVKDATKLRKSFSSTADYLADVNELGGISASDYSPEGTRLSGKLHIRFCILSFRTHLAHVDRALAEVATCLAAP